MVDAIRHAMGSGAAHGVHLRYAVEALPLGTAGGVRNAADLAGHRVLVLNGDVLTDLDLTAMLGFHTERQSSATIYLTRVTDPAPYGLVEAGVTGRIERFVEKPGPADVTTDTINAGVYILDRALLARIPAGRMVSIEREFFPALLADRLPCYAWVGDHYWLDIGSSATYLQGQLDLLAGRVATDVRPVGAGTDGRWVAEGVTLGPGAMITPPAVIGPGTRIAATGRVGPFAVLGERCSVGRGATVERAVLWEHVSVGDGVAVRDCIIGAGARIGAGAVLDAGVVLGPGARVPDGARLSP